MRRRVYSGALSFLFLDCVKRTVPDRRLTEYLDERRTSPNCAASLTPARITISSRRILDSWIRMLWPRCSRRICENVRGVATLPERDTYFLQCRSRCSRDLLHRYSTKSWPLHPARTTNRCMSSMDYRLARVPYRRCESHRHCPTWVRMHRRCYCTRYRRSSRGFRWRIEIRSSLSSSCSRPRRITRRRQRCR